ncbi:MAG: hypothetical protein NC093_03180 [Alistipes sp.]|nr:hypothetical protein [Alistipes sp.]
MGIFDKLFNHDAETDDEKELREYEAVYSPASGVADNTYSEFIVTDTDVLKETGLIVSGTVTAGSFRAGDRIIIVSPGADAVETRIVAVRQFGKMRSTVSEGANAGLLLNGIDRKQIKRNDLIKKVLDSKENDSNDVQ